MENEQITKYENWKEWFEQRTALTCVEDTKTRFSKFAYTRYKNRLNYSRKEMSFDLSDLLNPENQDSGVQACWIDLEKSKWHQTRNKSSRTLTIDYYRSLAAQKPREEVSSFLEASTTKNLIRARCKEIRKENKKDKKEKKDTKKLVDTKPETVSPFHTVASTPQEFHQKIARELVNSWDAKNRTILYAWFLEGSLNSPKLQAHLTLKKSTIYERWNKIQEELKATMKRNHCAHADQIAFLSALIEILEKDPEIKTSGLFE